jgi:hypothetical protein
MRPASWATRFRCVLETRKPDESSPLDNPFNPTYVRVIVIEIVVIALLYVLGRLFQ